MAFVMPEIEWMALCEKQCRARRKQYPDNAGDECERDGMCSECIADAADRVPRRYHTTAETAAQYDPLPGIHERS